MSEIDQEILAKLRKERSLMTDGFIGTCKCGAVMALTIFNPNDKRGTKRALGWAKEFISDGLDVKRVKREEMGCISECTCSKPEGVLAL